MVMAMNVRQGYKGHKRSRVRRKPASPRFPLPPLLAAGLMAGYVLGCCFGANASLPDPSDPVLSFLQSGGAGDTLYGGLLPELCVSCVYGFAFLLLSTSYLGFLLIPVVFGVKGFLSACTAAAFLRSGCAHAFALSCVAVGLPGLFLVPALFLLGVLCAQMSVRLMEQRRGLPPPAVTERCSRELALAFCLLLAAAATASYAVPFFTKLIL